MHSDLSWGYWTVTQEPDFSQRCCLSKMLKDSRHFCTEARKRIWTDKTFAKIAKASFLADFLNFFILLSPSEFFFSKNRYSSFFLLFDGLLHGKKLEKNWWSGDLPFQMNGKTNKARFIRHLCQGECPAWFYAM